MISSLPLIVLRHAGKKHTIFRYYTDWYQISLFDSFKELSVDTSSRYRHPS